MEWIEQGLKSALYADAIGLLESLLNDPQTPVNAEEKLPGEKSGGCHEKTVVSLFGPVQIHRRYYYNPSCHSGRYPMDMALGLENGYTPGVVRLMCRAGARESYEESSADLKAYAGIEVGAREINRMVLRIGPRMRGELESEQAGEHIKSVPRMYISCDGTGVPMRRSELLQTRGKGADGEAKTKEVKVGCIFTQHPKADQDPFRDCDSTSYIATMRRSHEFGPLLRQEAYRRGMGRAQEVVFVADGAAWIWETARTCFVGAVEILDYYHAHEYLTEIVDILYGKGSKEADRQLRRWKKLFFDDKVVLAIKQMRKACALQGDDESLCAKINYFENNKHRMLYGTYKSKGYFYGSGVVEAGCKCVVGKRAKQSGMFWSTPGVENVLAIRAALCSDRFDQYWDQRNAA